jgi:hypothetical protein
LASVDVRIDPAATMHARAASMRMPCSSSFMHASGGEAPRADTNTTVQILRYSCIVCSFIVQVSVRHCVFVVDAPRSIVDFETQFQKEQNCVSNNLNLHYRPVI